MHKITRNNSIRYGYCEADFRLSDACSSPCQSRTYTNEGNPFQFAAATQLLLVSEFQVCIKLSQVILFNWIVLQTTRSHTHTNTASCTSFSPPLSFSVLVWWAVWVVPDIEDGFFCYLYCLFAAPHRSSTHIQLNDFIVFTTRNQRYSVARPTETKTTAHCHEWMKWIKTKRKKMQPKSLIIKKKTNCAMRCAIVYVSAANVRIFLNNQVDIHRSQKNGYRRSNAKKKKTWMLYTRQVVTATTTTTAATTTAIQQPNRRKRQFARCGARNARLNSFFVYMCVRTHVVFNLTETNRWFLCMQKWPDVPTPLGHTHTRGHSR